ncbi:hypothetical protein CBL_08914 [Carabus blaptoides fortunei]
MVDCKSLIKEPGFYFKLIELILCILGSLFMRDVFNMNLHVMMTMFVAVSNCIITVGVLMILIVLEANNHITELCLNGAGAILNIIVGILLLVYMYKNVPMGHLLVAITSLACGIVMIIDCIREFKAK